MEQISFLLLIMSFIENFSITVMIYSFLSIKVLNRKFFLLVLIASISAITIRSFPVIPLIIIFASVFIFIIYIYFIYRINIIITTVSVVLSFLIYIFIEGTTLPFLMKISDYNIADIINNLGLRFAFFSVQLIFVFLIIFLIQYFNINLRKLISSFTLDDLHLLVNDRIDLKREKRVTKTFYIVLFFILFQTLFINFYILTENYTSYFNIHPIFSSTLFVNLLIIFFNIVLLYLLKHMFKTLSLERDDLINRIEEKNALRLDWEKRAQMHDRNHHLTMLYVLLQTDNINRAKEYLKGMVGEIQNIEARFRCGNQALNALIGSKIAKGKQACVNINVDVRSQLEKMSILDWELNRIIGNLLDNAIEALDKKDTEEKRVNLIIDNNGTYNEIEVITHNIYISDEEERRLFIRGYSSKEEKGHGLGLAICKEIIDEYDGEIIIEKDKEKKYTSFKIFLPVK